MTERAPFSIQTKVRTYELDPNGHVNHAVYHQYGEIARTELAVAAGVMEGMLKQGIGIVMLESHIRFRRELHFGDEVTVTCTARFEEDKKVFWMDNVITKLDGTVSAEIESTLGLMDLDKRKLVPGPFERMQDAGIDLDLLRAA
ncbi:thioesterase [Saccharomonospora sp. CUA-673]|uniref:acyl-CoA thioesterase n=1 Tax=Saccharomonospora sp. CUA-673 TaxID=1904969 RepID=UPI0009600E61|nr:acyl-CoA thioesterase [Saccharomonospora sp. CUA-673]OLT46578.1 thioesterase [Saccharomonospora sp. CUA-673]